MTLQDDFWNDPQHAQTLIRQLNGIKDIVESYEKLNSALIGLEETHDLLKEDYDDEIFELFEAEYLEMEKNFDDFEIKILLSHEYDHSSAILELHPGAGGTESCDWADMLYRMYSRWAEKKGFKVSMLDYLPGDEAGIKSVTFLVEGDMAYGYLKAETKRASGAGGQHINKTDSAVRMVHKPTGLVATCQNGRSQHENREEALRVLKSRLYQKMIEEQEARLAEIKGEQKANEWGSQIRSYVFHPYSMVKDHRTSCETSDVQGVMDGDLDAFIFAYLKTQI